MAVAIVMEEIPITTTEITSRETRITTEEKNNSFPEMTGSR